MLSHISQWITDVETSLPLFLGHFWKVEVSPFRKDDPLSLYCKQKTNTETHLAFSSPIKREMKDQEDWYYRQPVPFSSKWKIHSNSKWEKGKFLLLSNKSSTLQRTVKDICGKKICIYPIWFFQRIGQIWKTPANNN